MRYLVFFSLLISLFSCKPDDSEKVESGEVIPLKYAKGFSIIKENDFKVITINDAWRGEKSNQQYVLYKNDKPNGYKDALKIKVPISSIACMSLTHIAFIEALGEENSIVAVSGGKFTTNQKVKSYLSTGKIIEVGSAQSIDYESLVERNPTIIMAYGIDESSHKYTDKLKSLGLTSVLNAEYMEVHPLGKAEWIKFVAAFYEKEEEADKIFNQIEAKYQSLVSLVENVPSKPSVFVGMPWNGNWYVAGGKSFQAQLFKDAGANYIWKNNEEKSSIVKSKEVVINDALDADFWLNVNSYHSISSILAYDNRLSNFLAIKDSSVYNNDNKLNKFSGNEYWESGTINPHIILKDLIEIFHPNLIDHQLYYYRKLK